MRAAQAVAGSTVKPCNTADAPLAANPSYPCRFRFMLCCRLLVGNIPNRVGSASTEAKSATVAATLNTQTGSWGSTRIKNWRISATSSAQTA
jgi:hypothetical protein